MLPGVEGGAPVSGVVDSAYFDQPYNMGLIINSDLRLDLNGLIALIETGWMR